MDAAAEEQQAASEGERARLAHHKFNMNFVRGASLALRVHTPFLDLQALGCLRGSFLRFPGFCGPQGRIPVGSHLLIERRLLIHRLLQSSHYRLTPRSC